jgi:hypothetical protein
MRSILLCFLLLTGLRISAQALPPLPERIVSIDCSNCRTDKVLADISAQGRFEFAWNSQLFDPAKLVTIHAQNITVRRAIFLVFGNTITYKVKGNYLVLLAAPKPLAAAPAVKPRKQEYTLSGYITDASTGAILPHVSIYDSQTLASTLSDNYGHYTLKLSGSTDSVKLKVSRENYLDTSFFIVPSSNFTHDVSLHAIPPPPPLVIADTIIPADSVMEEPRRNVERYRFLDSLIGFKQITQARNLGEYFRRGGQISVVPFLSTNGMMTGNVVNRFSLNILGGYTGGTNGAEIGCIFNVDRQDVRWVQLAGAFNVVGGNLTGVQGAGAFNVNQGSLKGAQLAGGVNVTRRNLDGAQLAGGVNICANRVKGIQLSGGVNVAQDVDGFQVSGGANFASRTVTGMQVTGGVNIAHSVTGIQVGVVNIGKQVVGGQFGVFNFADSCSGLPVGVLSFVGSGVHQLEIATTERGTVSASFRTGVPALYNILVASYVPGATGTIWAFGYGIGHRFPFGSHFGLNLEGVMQHLNSGGFSAYTNEWTQGKLMLEWRPVKNFAIAAGPVFNYLLTEDLQAYSEIQQKPVFGGSPGAGYRDVAWIGGSLALRFF